MKQLIIMSLVILYLPFAKAENFCKLQPEGYDSSRSSMKEFEKNIQNEMTAIYQEQYPALVKPLQELHHLTKELDRMLIRFSRRYTKPTRYVAGRTKNIALQRSKTEHFLNLIASNIQSEEEFQAQLETQWIKPRFTFETYQETLSELEPIKQSIQQLQEIIQPIQQPHFLYTPEINFSIRGNEVYYGDLQLEVFFNLPKDNLFQLPILGIGFETNDNTVIYTCIHLDSFDSSKNVFYIYFLNTTKFYSSNWTDWILNSNLAIRHILTMRSPPKAIIAPLPMVGDPTGKIIKPMKGMFKVFSMAKPLAMVQDMASKLEVLSLTSSVNPAVKMVIDNVNFGIKGLHIHEDGVTMRYAATSFYGLLNINLIQQTYPIDTSPFINIMTLNKEEYIEETATYD